MKPTLKLNLPAFCFVIAALIFGSIQNAQAQEDSTEIDTEKLIIVKPYSPTVSDAFKVKQKPKLEDSSLLDKKKVTYDIFSFPVASTFTPTKGRASGIQRKALPQTYQNYASLGAGNYGNVNAEFYSTLNLSNAEELSFELTHNSSQGDIDGVDLDNKFYNTNLGLDYWAEASNFSWTANFGAGHQLYNWYGVPESSLIDRGVLQQSEFDQFITGIDPQHSFYRFNLGAGIDMESGILDDADLQYHHFLDNNGSNESHVLLKPHFQFKTGEELINVNFSMDFVSGSFGHYWLNNAYNLDYSIFNLGFAPSININRDNLAVQLGGKVVYSIDGEYDKNQFHVYPKIKASYRVAGDYFTLYAGADGDLKQNTYQGFVAENPFVSPTLYISPTDKQFDIYAGLKGKFTDKLGYDAQVSYKTENDKPLFTHNRSGTFYDGLKDYEHFNSFFVLYDDINTISVSGELNYQATEDLMLRFNGRLSSFDTENQPEAWNIPNWEASLNADFKITKKWSAGASVFAKGERQDLFSFRTAGQNSSETGTVTLDAFVDANLRLGYQLNDRLSLFVRGHNLLGENYERWYGYPVQGIQVLGGASYQFNW